jgi:hypothetical protein
MTLICSQLQHSDICTVQWYAYRDVRSLYIGDLPEGCFVCLWQKNEGESRGEGVRMSQSIHRAVLLENEGTSGMLFDVTLPSGEKHARGVDDGNVTPEQLRRERSGELPTGNLAVYPQMAGRSL